MNTGDYFYTVVVKRDTDEDDPIILDNISWLVEMLVDGEWDDAQVYTNEALSDVVTDYVTDDSGEITFWAGMGEYRITLTDLNDPVRIAPRYIYWMSIPYADFFALRFAGEIVMTGRSAAPDGWLLCDGAAVSRTEYARLFSAIGTFYGVGDGGTTFNLPDMVGRLPIGLGTHASIDELGDDDGLNAASRSPTHLHSQPSHGHAMPHTHDGTAAGANDVVTTSEADHSHTYEGGALVHSRRNVPETSNDAAEYEFLRDDGGGPDVYQPFDKQSLYIAGFNAAPGAGSEYDQAAAMDGDGGHSHTVDISTAAVSVGQPSATDTSTAGAENTGSVTVPHIVVNFLIRV